MRANIDHPTLICQGLGNKVANTECEPNKQTFHSIDLNMLLLHFALQCTRTGSLIDQILAIVDERLHFDIDVCIMTPVTPQMSEKTHIYVTTLLQL